MQPLDVSCHESKPRSSAWRPELVLGLAALGPFELVAPLVAGHPRGSAWPSLADYTAWAEEFGVVNTRGLPIRFVAAAAKKPRRRGASLSSDPRAYERSVYERGEVPTRPESWHDLFNVLVWLMFPKTKAALNERQYLSPSMPTSRDLERAQTRTREQDRLSMFDEGGMIVCDQTSYVVGHAIYEQLAVGSAPIRAIVLPVERESGLSVDAAAAKLIASCAFRSEASFSSRSLR